MTKAIRKLSALLASVMILFCIIAPVHAEGEDFDAFLTSQWIAMMEDDYMTMYFSVKDYRSMGIAKPEISLGKVGYAAFEEKTLKAREELEKLHAFDYESLNDTQKHDYLAYEKYLQDEISKYGYPDFFEVFNPYSGTLSSVKTLYTEFTFRQREDIDDYLTLAHDFSRYFDDALEFTKQQAAKGYFLLDIVLDAEIERLDSFTAKKEDNPFVVIFEKNVDAFEGLSDDEKAAYKEKNRGIVFNEIIPEHEKIKAELEALRGSRSTQKSVYYYPGGQEYYAAQARSRSSSELSPQEIFDYLTIATKQTIQKSAEIFLLDPTKMAGAHVTGFSSAEEVLEHLKNHMGSFPAGPDVNYELSYLDPSVANPSVVAYYLPCPVDDVRDNVIRINGDNTGDDLTTLYSTLSHEGFAGHLYQCTYYSSQNPNPIRHDIATIGYMEGWAQYVIRDLMKQSGLDEVSAAANYLDTYTGYAFQSAVDVAVNGLGYDVPQLSEWCKSQGFSFNEKTLQTIYDAVIGMPARILPYGFGQMKFFEYRERMISSLGEDFDEVDFHRQLLDQGPRSFEVIEKDLEQYCEARGTTFQKEFTFFASEVITADPNSTGAKLLKYLPFIVIGVSLVFLLILFFIIRGIIRLFKKKS